MSSVRGLYDVTIAKTPCDHKAPTTVGKAKALDDGIYTHTLLRDLYDTVYCISYHHSHEQSEPLDPVHPQVQQGREKKD